MIAKAVAMIYKRVFSALAQCWLCLRSSKATPPYGVFTKAGCYADRHGVLTASQDTAK